MKKAKNVKITIDGTDYELTPKKNSTGSYGWNLSGKKQTVKKNIKLFLKKKDLT